MVLNDREIRALLKHGELVLTPFEDALVKPSSVDLRLDSFARVIEAGTGEIDIRSADQGASQEVNITAEGYVIEPGGMLIGQTFEHMKIPDRCQGMIAQRSSVMRLGVHVSSSLINPGYAGNLPCLISNRTGRPLRIFAGIPFCQLVLLGLSSRPDATYPEQVDAKYQGEKRFLPSAIAIDAQRWIRPRAGTPPVKLEDALRYKVSVAGVEFGLEFKSLRRASVYEIHLLCRDGEGRFWPIIARIDRPATPLVGGELDQALYAAANLAIDDFLKDFREKHGTT
jgi:dCTP deaminase